jgi:DNA polymerase III subunit delta'
MVDEKMTFIDFNIQKPIWSKLSQLKSNHRIANAYLFSGCRGSGKEAIALKFAAYVNCPVIDGPCGECSSCRRFRSLQHEHLKLIVPMPRNEKLSVSADVAALLDATKIKAKNPFYKITLPKANTIPISHIRKLKRDLYLKSIETGRKIVLIYDAHMLCAGDASSANAILKILEEPPNNTTFILVTDYKADLLPTILSRCQCLDFPALKRDDVVAYLLSSGVEDYLAQFAANIADGDMRRALALTDFGKNDILELVKTLRDLVSEEQIENWRSFNQNYSRMAKNNFHEFEFHLFLLQWWLNQAYLQRVGINNSDGINGMSTDLREFNIKFPNADFYKINKIIEETIIAPRKNLYMPLILTNFLIGIQQSLDK